MTIGPWSYVPAVCLRGPKEGQGRRSQSKRGRLRPKGDNVSRGESACGVLGAGTWAPLRHFCRGANGSLPTATRRPIELPKNNPLLRGAQRRRGACLRDGHRERRPDESGRQVLGGTHCHSAGGEPDPATAPPPRTAFGTAGSRPPESMTPLEEEEHLPAQQGRHASNQEPDPLPTIIRG